MTSHSLFGSILCLSLSPINCYGFNEILAEAGFPAIARLDYAQLDYRQNGSEQIQLKERWLRRNYLVASNAQRPSFPIFAAMAFGDVRYAFTASVRPRT